MLRFLPDHLKTKKICKNAVKKLSFVITYVNWYKTQDMRNRVILENGGTLMFVSDC